MTHGRLAQEVVPPHGSCGRIVLATAATALRPELVDVRDDIGFQPFWADARAAETVRGIATDYERDKPDQKR